MSGEGLGVRFKIHTERGPRPQRRAAAASRPSSPPSPSESRATLRHGTSHRLKPRYPRRAAVPRRGIFHRAGAAGKGKMASSAFVFVSDAKYHMSSVHYGGVTPDHLPNGELCRGERKGRREMKAAHVGGRPN